MARRRRSRPILQPSLESLANKMAGLYFFEEKVRDEGKVTTYDEARQAAFIHGVKWCLDAMEHDVYSSHHPMASPADNKYLDSLTLAEIKKFIKKMKSKDPAQKSGEGHK